MLGRKVPLAMGESAERSRYTAHRVADDPVNRDALRGAYAGVASVMFLFTAFASFGPWFSYELGYALTITSFASSVLGLRWAHRASHSLRRSPGQFGRANARLALLASLFGLFASSLYLGYLLVLLFPFVWAILVPFLVAAGTLHVERRDVENTFAASVDPVAREASCMRCGRRAALSEGRWGRRAWMCGTCRAMATPVRRHAWGRAFVIAMLAASAVVVGSLGPVAAFCEIVEQASDIPTQVNGTLVEISLEEGFARIVIIKEFYNPSERFKEGQIFFPLEKGHELITDLRLKVGNVEYNSSAQDRGEALEDFLEALSNGQDAAIIQYDAPRDVYWIAVTIPPKATRTTVTTLEMPLFQVDGGYGYHYRLSVDAAHSVDYLKVHVRVETAGPLGKVSFPHHTNVAVVRSGDRVAEGWINSTLEAHGHDLEIRFRAPGTSASQFVVPETTERYVRMTVDAGDATFAEDLARLPRSFLVLVDASGSMERSGRWPLAAGAVRALLETLDGRDSFALASFHGRTVDVLDSRLLGVSPVTIERAARFLEGIEPRGSTSLSTALPMAASWARDARATGRQPVLFLVSDGEPTVAVDPEDLLRLENEFKRFAYDSGAPVFALAAKPSGHPQENLLRNLTHFNDGSVVALSDGDNRPAIEALASSVRLPVLHDVRVAVPGTDVLFANPGAQSVREGEEVLALARMDGALDDPLDVEIAVGAEDQPDSRHAWSFDGADLPAQPLLKRQWVLTRIHHLLDQLRAREDAATVEDLKALATANRVVTPYTSLVVIIPRESSNGQGDRPVPPGAAVAFDFFSGGTAGSPSASGSGGFLPRFTPLGWEGERARRYRQDTSTALYANGEVDRWVVEGSEEHRRIQGEAGSGLAQARVSGTFLTIYEQGGELIGVRSDWLDPANAPATYAFSATWGFFAALAAVTLLRIRDAAREARKRERL